MTPHVKLAKRKGFVLVTVVFLIMFCSMVLVGIARRTLNVRVQAIAQKDELQRKWGTATLERFLLRNPESLIQNSIPNNSINNRAYFQIRLGGYDFEGLLSNEQAKANVSTILNNRGINYVAKRLDDIDLDKVRLAPNPEDPSNLGTTSFNSWGQIFDLASVSRNGIPSFLMENTQAITLWGTGGKLDLKNASDDSIRAILELAVSRSKTRKFIGKFREDKTADIDAIMNQTGLTDKEMTNVKRLLTDRSTCFSVLCTATKNSRRYIRFVVLERIGSQKRTWTFSW